MDTLGKRVSELKGDTHIDMEYGNQKVNLFRCPFCGSTPADWNQRDWNQVPDGGGKDT